MEKPRRMMQVLRFTLPFGAKFERLYGSAALFSLKKHC